MPQRDREDRSIAEHHTRVVAVIPARGGSKGIAGKNLCLVGGVPLLVRTIRAARSAALVDQVWVTSDDGAILEVARLEGAKTIRRPDELAGDMASSEGALLHALATMRGLGLAPELLVFLQCTSPFTKGEQIDAVVEALRLSGAAMAFSAQPWHGFLWRIDSNGWGVGVNHNAEQPRQRRQELTPCWLETGAIYVMETTRFEAVGNRFIAPQLPVPLDDLSPEIDTHEDLAICELMATLLDPPVPSS